ncbi:BTB/POZ domain-containing protein At3g05675 isoform X1 [Lycium ferocissimum]|uniref:BTB/POZ domain-containing protein At3g05675 isoform X1 n=1 Tax=Lycium ferocissimum TaxID=112874 RepID=UPI002814F4D9|nr:BTB/POZ domain-containing protein At3g05675 isoform X1 [Lycium ferocissimum]XP_059278531.1 BTB/POZ domain-containing protein At3g05675 isoform X1 [Lycium ferocissimum]XP_059278532.1 BTB/POZ domain-containing protein At3g05675 isoform X1 [Lycium ferocissimum]XP_059278533.1 BTB/POZ domain-containing protein At3g05675 isoform X1 [Lycium ferocissimum]XP_059278534.1 BTB/POZ domain-containing protein At3g05675 isoform X1 [Lycium ferocissimum]XP_059278535.1 BTB/POZ domain-containing protein At3g05
MEIAPNELKTPSKIGDRPTSDVVVRLRTQDGRDDWLYCHSHILVEESKYFADRLSDSWPTCQILDSRNCVEVYCEEPDLDSHVNVLRLLYVVADGLMTEICHGVKNALGILRVAVKLGCPRVIAVCVDYLEAVPWEEAEEEEILNTIPGMGSNAEPVLARLQPVNPTAVMKIFLAALQFATSSPPSPLNDLKNTAQEQLEYMLTEDDDAPLLTADEEIKLEVMRCVKNLFDRFKSLVESLLCDLQESILDLGKMQSLHSYLTDLLWACQILGKLEIIRDFVCSWTELSVKVLTIVQQKDAENQILKTKLKVLEVTTKVLEAVGHGVVVLPTVKRLHMVKLWLPFVRTVKPLVDSVTETEDDITLKVDSDIWQSLESAFVAIILTLPSVDQTDILTEWFENQQIWYPDLTEAFEVWCYRSKVAKRRLTTLGEEHNMAKADLWRVRAT